MELVEFPQEILLNILDFCAVSSLSSLVEVNQLFFSLIVSNDGEYHFSRKDKNGVICNYMYSRFVERIIEDDATLLTAFIRIFLFGGEDIRTLMIGEISFYFFQTNFRKFMKYLLVCKKVKMLDTWSIDYYFNIDAYPGEPPPLEFVKMLLENRNYEFELAPEYVLEGAKRDKSYLPLKNLFAEYGLFEKCQCSRCSPSDVVHRRVRLSV